MSKDAIEPKSEFFQRVHKSYIEEEKVKMSFFVNEIKREFKMQMSVDFDQKTIPPKDPNYTKNKARKPYENAVIAHIKERVDLYPMLEWVIPEPVDNNPAHYEIQFNRELSELQSNKRRLLDEIEKIANHITGQYVWKIKLATPEQSKLDSFVHQK